MALVVFAEQRLKQQLGKIRSNVDKFQRDLQDVKPSPEFVEKLKDIMEEIENSMMTFKEQQRKVYVLYLIQGSIFIFSQSRQPGKYSKKHACPCKILVALSKVENYR